MLKILRKIFIGKPLHNNQLSQEKLPKWKALAIFSSDALSSVGYGPEQIALTLALPGLLVYAYMGYVALAVLLLLAIVTISYVQVARANPGGGGSYSVAIHNLGEWPALIAAASLFADYTLTVAVSISSGTEAIVSAFPRLVGHEVSIDLFVLFGVLMIINFRGVRESSNVFVLPTYLFIFGIAALIISGLLQVFSGTAPLLPEASRVKQPLDLAVVALILRAFANGCSSMTGVEAISNGVPMFKTPEVGNAIKTTFWMSGILGLMLAGIAFLFMHHHLLPMENTTMLSQLTEIIFGRGWSYFYIQITTMMVLYLAANTSYNGLPPLLSLLARDGYMPRYLGLRGERLNFSNGILLLSVVAGILILIFDGNVEHLISLYAIGVFLSFTIAQVGMVVHWRRTKGAHWLTRSVINSLGATITGIVVLVIAFTKFFYGAWLVLVFIPAMIYVFREIKSHYRDMSEQLHLSAAKDAPAIGKNIVVVPVSTPTAVVAETMRYAKMLSNKVIALNVATDEEAAAKLKQKWAEWSPEDELTVIYSPYRLVVKPILQYIEKLEKHKNPHDFITVIIPEFETRKWWHRLLHNQTGWILRTVLILKKNVAVTTIPYHLGK